MLCVIKVRNMLGEVAVQRVHNSSGLHSQRVLSVLVSPEQINRRELPCDLRRVQRDEVANIFTYYFEKVIIWSCTVTNHKTIRTGRVNLRLQHNLIFFLNLVASSWHVTTEQHISNKSPALPITELTWSGWCRNGRFNLKKKKVNYTAKLFTHQFKTEIIFPHQLFVLSR